MRFGRFEIYNYKTKLDGDRFVNYSNDEFYGKGKKIRWNIFLFGYVFDIDWHEKRRIK